MRRREFISLFGAGAAAWPLSARAQQSPKPVIGYLNAGSPGTTPDYLLAFRHGLSEAGFVEGQNVMIEYRWADNNFDRLPALATDLVRRQVNVIAATGGSTPPVAAKAATTTIPIVFTSGADPVGSGLVVSLSRPGGNLTGMSLFYAELGEKRLQLLRELIPKTDVIAFLVNLKFPEGQAQLKDVQAAARRSGQQLNILNASTLPEIDAAFASLTSRMPDGLLVASDALFVSDRGRIIKLAANQTLPAVYFEHAFVEFGGLMSYGTDIKEMYRQAGIYTARILKGEKPADLPVIQPTKFEFAINLKTAKALGLTIPPGVLAIADEVIE
jgi:putative tryptophan/tyrosine transport system substrate-binding protein